MNICRALLVPALLCGVHANAQVTIPDPVFAAELESAVPDAMTGDQLDPTHPSVAALDYLDLEGLGIADLSGIEYFTGLNILDVSFNPITYLPALPSNMNHLTISYTMLPSMPVLPDSLWQLSMAGMQFTVFDPFPSGVHNLDMSNNTITAMGALPESLYQLSVRSCGLDVLPAAVLQAQNLQVIYMDWNPTNEFLELPPNLHAWECDECGLMSLPDLPSTMTGLWVPNNPLTQVPELPGGLVALNIDNTGVAVLPPFPSTMLDLKARGSALTEVPVLPDGMSTVQVANTLVSCLRNLPESVTVLELPVGVECLPAEMSSEALFHANLEGFPTPGLCTNFNTICAQEPYIEGFTWHDSDANGLNDDGGAPLPYTQMLIEPGGIQFGSSTTGVFRTHVQPGTYTTAVVPGPYQTATTSALIHDLPDATTVVTGSDHGISVASDVTDMLILLTPGQEFRPGLNATCRLDYHSIGSLPGTGTITLNFDPQLQFSSSSVAPTTTSAGTATWDYSAGALDLDGSILVDLYLPPGVALGTELLLSATVSTDAPDADMSNNEDHMTRIVVGSFDPNDKLVSPSVLSPAEVAAGTPVGYTIRFQNTGTASALLVRIQDVLDPRLEVGTFRFLSSSHPCAWYIEQGVLSFVFEGINLPDSSSDEPGSHGFVRFEITPASTLVLNESVENTAAIYFDFNEPVITAPAIFSVEEAMGVVEYGANGITVGPNPASDFVAIRCNGLIGQATVRLRDAAGRVVKTVNLREDTAVLDLHGLAPGVYTARIDGDARTARVVKR